MDLHGLARLLMGVGVVFLALGVLLMVAGLVAVKVPLLGRLPGDLVFHKGNFTFFAPVATMVVLSLILTIAVNLVARLFR